MFFLLSLPSPSDQSDQFSAERGQGHEPPSHGATPPSIDILCPTISSRVCRDYTFVFPAYSFIILVFVPNNLDLNLASRVNPQPQNNHRVPRVSSKEIQLRGRRGATLGACRWAVVV